MNESSSSTSSSIYKIFAILGLLLSMCCLGFMGYIAALFIIIDKDINLVPAPTIDPTCEEANCLKACIHRLPDFNTTSLTRNVSELAKKPGGYELARYRLNEQTSELDQVATPTVPDYLKSHQANIELHRRIWDYFTSIFPNDADIHVSYMVVVMDASQGRYSARMWDLDGKWRLYVNLFDFHSPETVMNTLTHEYGHLLTLNKTQIRHIENEYGRDTEQAEFDKMQAVCGGLFFNGFDCARAESYLNAFGNRFWAGEVYNDWMKTFLMADNDFDGYKNSLDEIYQKYSDQFVTPYSSTNPREDIAESWTEFVLRPKPIGPSIANQKVLFFYEFPELVQSRQEIIQGICQYAIEQK